MHAISIRRYVTDDDSRCQKYADMGIIVNSWKEKRKKVISLSFIRFLNFVPCSKVSTARRQKAKCFNVNRFAFKRKREKKKNETEIEIKNDVKYLKSSTENLFFLQRESFS